jgi:aryl-alcohol dehydrogenase
MDIRAAVSRGKFLKLSVETVQLAEPREDEILVRLVATGICHTDLKVCQDGIRLPRPVVLGHEGSGVVERVGSRVTKVVSGDHVVMTFNFAARARAAWRSGRHCREAHPRNFGGPAGRLQCLVARRRAHPWQFFRPVVFCEFCALQ